MDNSHSPDIIKPRNILVAGANGFIGRHLCRFLRAQGYNVTAADKSGKGIILFDALQPLQWTKLLREISPDVIFNLIGYTDEGNPELVFRLNIFPLINIVKSLNSLGMKTRIITMGSAAEYGPVSKRSRPLAENDAKTPISHYGVSKLSQTMLAGVFHNSDNTDLVVARPFNIMGYGMSVNSVPACFIGQFFENFANQGRTGIQTSPLDPVRDFLTVNDVVEGLHFVMLRGASGENYNICSGEGIEIRMILAKIADLFPGREYQIIESKGAGGIPWSVGDNSKLKSLGWRQKESVEAGLIDLVRLMMEDIKKTGITD
jgi:GDP-4-dehydro-6-deoxy-D-mannose reductase